jgi:hypothetical protein
MAVTKSERNVSTQNMRFNRKAESVIDFKISRRFSLSWITDSNKMDMEKKNVEKCGLV